jgi:hypothetical protein
MASKDSIPKSGTGSEASHLSDSPLAIRRGNADPTNVDPSPVQMSSATTRTRCSRRRRSKKPAAVSSDGDRTGDSAASRTHPDEHGSERASRRADLNDGTLTVRDSTTGQSMTMRLAVTVWDDVLTLVAVSDP